MSDRFDLVRQAARWPERARRGLAIPGTRGLVRWEPSPAGLAAAGVSLAVVLRFAWRLARQALVLRSRAMSRSQPNGGARGESVQLLVMQGIERMAADGSALRVVSVVHRIVRFGRDS